MKHKELKFLSLLLVLTLLVGLVPGMSLTAYANSVIRGDRIAVYDSDSGTLSSDMTCSKFDVFDSGTLTISQGVTLTLNCGDYDFTLFDNSKMELHGILTGSVSNGAWGYNSYINVYLSDGAKYTVTGLSCEDDYSGQNEYLVYYGYDAATDGNGTVSVKNGSTDVTSASKGYKTTTYTFTATPNTGYKFKNWTKGAGGEVLGTGASINVTCEQNGQYQVYANFEADAAPTYTVTYIANNGTDEKAVEDNRAAGDYIIQAYEKNFTAPEGKVFDCWQGSDGNTYKYGDTATLTADLTLKAQWKEEKKPDGGEKKTSGGGSGFDLVFNIPGEDNSWEYVGGGYAPQQAYRVSLAPMQGGSAALGLTTGDSGTQMNVYPSTTVYVFPNAEQGYTLDKIVWSLIDGSASYDITEAKNFVMPAMDVVVYVTFRPVG